MDCTLRVAPVHVGQTAAKITKTAQWDGQRVSRKSSLTLRYPHKISIKNNALLDKNKT
jgi:hypothetical protein